MITLVLIGVIILPIIYFLSKTIKIKKIENTNEYFIANKKIKQYDFIDTTVAYGYQVAAISLFAAWGYIYGFWTILVPIFWGLGYYLLIQLNKKGYLEKFIQSSDGLTIHGYLGEKYKSKRIIRIAAFASMLGLSGTAFFEAEFTSTLITTANSTQTYESYFIILFVFFILVALIYILRGGFKAIVDTDKIQLKIGFIGLTIFIAITFNKIIWNGYVYSGMIFNLLTLICYAYLLYKIKKLNKIISSNTKDSRITISIALSIISIGFIVGLIKCLNTTPTDSFSYFFSSNKFEDIFALGFLPIVSLLLANGLWQIVDISNWQRLSSLNVEGSEYKEHLNKSFGFIGIYSPVTWLIAIFLGMSIKYLGIDFANGWNTLPELAQVYLNAGNIWNITYILIFIIALESIMFSTLDTLILAISYTTYYDIILVGDIKNNRSLFEARMWTILYTVIFFIIYLFVRFNVNGIDNILYTFYSFQLSLFPAILWMLFSKEINKLAGYGSILFGMMVCIIPLFVNSELINPYSSAATFAIIGSTFIYYLLSKIKKYNLAND